MEGGGQVSRRLPREQSSDCAPGKGRDIQPRKDERELAPSGVLLALGNSTIIPARLEHLGQALMVVGERPMGRADSLEAREVVLRKPKQKQGSRSARGSKGRMQTMSARVLFRLDNIASSRVRNAPLAAEGVQTGTLRAVRARLSRGRRLRAAAV
jgi:hypothetical protein